MPSTRSALSLPIRPLLLTLIGAPTPFLTLNCMAGPGVVRVSAVPLFALFDLPRIIDLPVAAKAMESIAITRRNPMVRAETAVLSWCMSMAPCG